MATGSVTDEPPSPFARHPTFGQGEDTIDHDVPYTLRQLRRVVHSATVGIAIPVEHDDVGMATSGDSPSVFKAKTASRQRRHSIDRIWKGQDPCFPDHSTQEPRCPRIGSVKFFIRQYAIGRERRGI